MSRLVHAWNWMQELYGIMDRELIGIVVELDYVWK